jgi:hypothetical protein
VSSALCIVSSALCIVSSALCIVSSALCVVSSALCVESSALCKEIHARWEHVPGAPCEYLGATDVLDGLGETAHGSIVPNDGTMSFT